MPEPTQHRVVDILLGEAAGEGEEGLKFVRDIMATRAKQRGLTLEEVANQPAQFSAAQRPDLAAFVAQQPMEVRVLAERLVQEALQEGFEPRYPYENYTTTQFYNDRAKLPKSHWVNAMEPAETIGHHVALRPRR